MKVIKRSSKPKSLFLTILIYSFLLLFISYAMINHYSIIGGLHTSYYKSDDLIKNAVIGETYSFPILLDEWSCKNPTTVMTVCTWMSQNSINGNVIVEFPQAKNLRPDMGGDVDVTVLSRQNNSLITEIESIYWSAS